MVSTMPKPVYRCSRCARFPRRPPWSICGRCMSASHTVGAKARWYRHRANTEAREAAYALPATTPRPDLDRLADEAEAAGAKALKVLASIEAARRKPVPDRS